MHIHIQCNIQMCLLHKHTTCMEPGRHWAQPGACAGSCKVYVWTYHNPASVFLKSGAPRSLELGFRMPNTKRHMCWSHFEARCCACRVKKVYLEGFLFNVSKGVIPNTPYPILLISSIWRSPWEKHPKHLQPVQMSMPAQRASKFCATRCAVLPEVFSFIVQFPASRTTL